MTITPSKWTLPDLKPALSRLFGQIKALPLELLRSGMLAQNESAESGRTVPYEERLQELWKLHAEAADGNVDAALEAYYTCEQLSAEYPGQPVIDGLLGSIMTLVAPRKTDPIERYRLARDGMRLLDAAVSAEPENLQLRKLRGKAAYRLPEAYFQRTETAIEDYLLLIDASLDESAQLEPDEYDQLIYELGDAYRRTHRLQEAQYCWNMLLKQTANPAYRQLVNGKPGSGDDAQNGAVHRTKDTVSVNGARPAVRLVDHWNGTGTAGEAEAPALSDWLSALVCLAGASLISKIRS